MSTDLSPTQAFQDAAREWRASLRASVTPCPCCLHKPALRHYSLTPRMGLATIFLYHRREQPPIALSEFPVDLTRAGTLRKLVLWGLASAHGVYGCRITPLGELFARGEQNIAYTCAAAHGEPMYFGLVRVNIEQVLGPRHSWSELMAEPAAEPA
jgi:hypothetical protein